MTADHPTREEWYAAVLAEHRLMARGAVARMGCRGCDFHGTLRPETRAAWDEFAAHVAAALVAADPAPEAETLAAVRETLRRVRSGRRLSLRAVAVECGVSFNTLSRIERGTVDPSLSHVVAILHWAADPAPAQPDAALSDEEGLRDAVTALADRWEREAAQDRDVESKTLRMVVAYLRAILAARAAQPVPAPDVSRGVAEVNIIQRIVNAWDCCATCAGGVLARHDREVKAEALREAADDWPREVNAETIRREIATFDLRDIPEEYRVDQWLRDRADRLVRDALGGERGDGA